MKKRTLLWLVLALVVFGGGAWMAQETNLFGGITLSPRAKQLAYLKEHIVTIVLYNITEIIGNLTPVAQKRLEFILKQGLLAGYASLAITNQSISRNIEAPLRLAKGFKQALISMRINDQNVVPVAKKPLRETMLENQVHYFVCESTYIKIKALMR